MSFTQVKAVIITFVVTVVVAAIGLTMYLKHADRLLREEAQRRADAEAVADLGFDADGIYRLICRNGAKPVVETTDRGAVKKVECPL